MNARKWTRGVLGGAATLVILAGEAMAQAPPAAPAPKPVAVVDGHMITQADVDELLRARPSAVPIPAAQRRQMQMEAITMMVDDLLLQKFLREKGPRVDPAEVARQMGDLEQGLKKQGKTLADFLKETGQTEAEVRDAQMLMLQWAAYLRVRITDPELKRCFDENREFFDDARVRASHIVLRLPAGTPDAERQAARNRLLALRQEIVTGRIDFAQAAMKHSQCRSAPQGGDIGTFPRKFVVDEAFAKAAFALAIGQVSDVVQTEQGLHLIKVTERTPGQPADFTKVRDDVRGLCAEELRQTVLAEMRRTTRVDINLP